LSASAQRFSGAVVRVLAILYAGAATFPGQFSAVGVGLDHSWVWAINAVGLHGFGPTVAFTYGPLGLLFYPAPVGEHVLAGALFRVATQLSFVAVFALAARRATAWQTVAFAALYSLAAGAGLGLDFHLLMIAAAAAALCVEARSGWGLALVGLLTAPLLFTKTTSEFASLAILGSAGVLYLRDWRRVPAPHRRRLLAAPLAALALHCAGCFALGLALFPSAAELAGWLRISSQIASGYSVAMSYTDGSHVSWGIGLGAVWIFAAAALLWRRSPAAPMAAIAAPLVFLAFKQGYVREDLHVLAFYAALFACAGLLVLFAGVGLDRLRAPVFSLSLAVAVLTIGLRGDALRWDWFRDVLSLRRGLAQMSQSLHPRRTHEELLAARAVGADLLPARTLEKLRGAAVGVIPWELSLCEANGLRCSWSPTLQTYAAYTEPLDRLTAAHFAGPLAPDFVLVDLLPEFDGRFPHLDAPATWQALLANYQLREVPLRGPLILEKKPAGPSATPLGEERVRVGDWIDVPKSADLVFADLDLRLNERGRLAKVLLRVPAVWLEAEYESGRKLRARISPENTRGGLLVSDLPSSLEQLGSVLSGHRVDPVRRIAINGQGTAYLEKRLVVRWLAMPRPAVVPPPPPPNARVLPGQPRLKLDDVAGKSYEAGRAVELSGGVLTLHGWALAPAAGQPVCGVLLSIDGGRVMPLMYGLERFDLAEASGVASDGRGGFSGTVTGLAKGPHQLELRVLGEDCAAYWQSAETIQLDVR
jgi:hypothetical protein